ncbi:unnamed protein product [Heterobilharzia americana]|nr:unnamed protein product [Heterobilharzia americana]
MALIGYIGPQIQEQKLDFCENVFGGNLITFPSIKPPSDEKIQCVQCHEPMDFLMQLYCPIGDSKYHRNLYFFVCLKQSCQVSGSNWKVLRSQYFTNSDQPQSKPCTNKNSEVQQEQESIHGQISSLIGRFQCHSIDIYEDTANITESIIDTKDNENETHSHSSSVKQFLSKWSENVLVDQEFIEEDDNTLPESFGDALQFYISSRGEYGCEDIRYCWSGRPIFNSLPPSDLEQYLTCSECGSDRVFELQIFSTLNNSLKISTNDQLDEHLERLNPNWLLNIITVLIFTCRNSCWKETNDWIEECVVVQTENNITKINNTIHR